MKISILNLKEEYTDYPTRPIMSSPEKVYEILKPLFLPDRETFYLLSLNTKNGIIAIRTISIGSLNSNVVHPREVFKAAILDSASSVIVAHNHPSGDASPSKEDLAITKNLVETGKIIGITLTDHVIIGDGRHYSMKESGSI